MPKTDIHPHFPGYQDEVKHKTDDITGTVIAKYADSIDGQVYIDVRGDDERIYYNSPVENWTTVRTREELEGS